MRIFRGGVRSIDMRALTMIVYFVTSEYQRFIVLRPSSTLPPAAAHLYRQFCLIGCSSQILNQHVHAAEVWEESSQRCSQSRKRRRIWSWSSDVGFVRMLNRDHHSNNNVIIIRTCTNHWPAYLLGLSQALLFLQLMGPF